MKSKLAFIRQIRKLAEENSIPYFSLERQVAHLAVAEILLKPDFAELAQITFKGGTTIFWSLPMRATRATADLDASSSLDRLAVVSLLESLAGARWGYLHIGAIRVMPEKTRTVVDPEFRLVEARVSLFVGDSHWRTVTLEVLPATGSSSSPSRQALTPEFAQVVVALGLPTPSQLPVLNRYRQVAEKLHGATAPGRRRGHDLYDIALLLRNFDFNTDDLASAVLEVFTERNTHAWGSGFDHLPDLVDIYFAETDGLPDAPAFAQALLQVLELKRDIDAALQARD